MKNLRRLALTVSVVVLTACASTTPYQAASKPGGFDGYSQTMIENDRARVTFGGNSLTERETVENYLLYRAAELAVERGFETFTLTQRDTEENTRIRPGSSFGAYDPFFNYSFYRPRFGWSGYHPYSRFYDPFYRPRRGRLSGFGDFSDPFFNDFNYDEITKYRASAEVKFGRSERTLDDNTFKAREVLQNLGPTIIYPEEKG